MRGSVEEALNELPEAETKELLPQVSSTNAMGSAKAIAAGTLAAVSPPLPETSPLTKTYKTAIIERY